MFGLVGQAFGPHPILSRILSENNLQSGYFVLPVASVDSGH